MNKWERIRLAISILAIISCVLLAFWASYEARDARLKIEQYIEEQQTVQHIPADGKDGITTVIRENIVTTLPAPKPVDGTNGADGKNATDEQVAAAVENYMSKNPPTAGKDGKDGMPGVTVFIRKNSVTMTAECRVNDDIRWRPIAECL